MYELVIISEKSMEVVVEYEGCGWEEDPPDFSTNSIVTDQIFRTSNMDIIKSIVQKIGMDEQGRLMNCNEHLPFILEKCKLYGCTNIKYAYIEKKEDIKDELLVALGLD